MTEHTLRPVDRYPPRFYRHRTTKEVIELYWGAHICLWDGSSIVRGNIRCEPSYGSEFVDVELRSKAIVRLVIVDPHHAPKGPVYSDDREFVAVVYDAPRENEGGEFDY